MMDNRITLAFDGHIATLTLNRPEKLNALDMGMVDGILDACRAIERSGARACILTGAGGKAFCAGGDIEAWAALSARDFARAWIKDGHRAFDALAQLSVPVIAVINGVALGGGLELAACADFRIAEAHARFSMPEAGIAMIPGWSGTQRLVRRFGAQNVRRMALAGEAYDAQEAVRLGLADRVAATGEGIIAARAMADVIGARGPLAVEMIKRLVNAAEGEGPEAAGEMIASAYVAGSDDLREGVAAFREKRKPRF